MITIQHNIANLNQALHQYALLSRKSSQEILIKQGGKLAREMKQVMLRARAGKGEIKAQLLARLAGGKGIKVRPEVEEQVKAKWSKTWAKRVAAHEKKWWGDTPDEKWSLQQELVRREIAVRASGRGFMALVTRFPISGPEAAKAISRQGHLLGEAGLKMVTDGGAFKIAWTSLSKHGQRAASGIGRPIGQRALAVAIKAVTDDINAYVIPRQARLIEQAAQLMVKKAGVMNVKATAV